MLDYVRVINFRIIIIIIIIMWSETLVLGEDRSQTNLGLSLKVVVFNAN